MQELDLSNRSIDKPKSHQRHDCVPSISQGIFKLVMNKVQGQKFAEGHYYLIIEKFSGKK